MTLQYHTSILQCPRPQSPWPQKRPTCVTSPASWCRRGQVTYAIRPVMRILTVCWPSSSMTPAILAKIPPSVAAWPRNSASRDISWMVINSHSELANPIQIWPSSCFYVPSAARNVKAARGADLNRLMNSQTHSAFSPQSTLKRYPMIRPWGRDMWSLLGVLNRTCSLPSPYIRYRVIWDNIIHNGL